MPRRRREEVETSSGVRERGNGRSSARGVAVRDHGIAVERTAGDVGVRAARQRFGGLDVPASLVGMLTAIALVVLLGGLIGSAIGAIGYQRGLEGAEQEISLAGLAGGLVVLFLAYFVGGWAAGRIARYDGVRNGLMTGVWTLLLGALFAGLGAWAGAEYDVFRSVELPQWLSRDALTVAGIVTAALAILAMLGGGALGGSRGERFHRAADATIAANRRGGLGAERG
ncbi:MAG: hypothetical protein ICV64_08575 [Thermoleophilia bacterium]|nr:hypothetical protein [Thermoleophilia bacterium]